MFESYILTTDGKDYVDANSVREALGIVDEYVDIFGVIKKLKEERDQFKEKCDKMKRRANAVYGVSCGKEPAFLCDVISYNKAEGFRKEKRAAEDSLAELRAKIREIYRSVVDDEWDEYRGYTAALNDINEEYKRVVHNFEERTADWSKAQQELDRLEKFRRDVAKRIGRDPDVIKTPEVIMHALDIELERGENMDKLRDKLMDILGYEVKPGGVDKNNQAILEQVKKLKESAGHDKLFRDSVCDALDTTTAVSDSYLFKNIEKLKLDHKEIQEKYSRYCLAVGSLCNIPAEHREDISWIEDAFNHTKKDYLKWKTTADKLARLRSNVCTALCLGGETDDEDILNAITKMREEGNKLARLWSNICSAFSLVPENCDGNIIGHIHDKLCKDYTEFRKAIWDAMDRKPETLPEENARLVGEVRMFAECKKHIREFRDAVAKAIGITYPTTNNFILKRVSDIYKECGEAHDLAMELDRKCIDLTAKNSDLQQKFEFQSGLRQQWHARYESEHERANGVQKCLDKTRETLRVKDISLETTKEQYEKVCGDLETAECAINGMKGKVRSLREEKTKVISALGQDIWDDCVK